jgi:hypothetical protein
MTSPRSLGRRKQRCQSYGRAAHCFADGLRAILYPHPKRLLHSRAIEEPAIRLALAKEASQERKEAINLQVPLVEADSLAGLVSSLFGRAVNSVFKLGEDSPQ